MLKQAAGLDVADVGDIAEAETTDVSPEPSIQRTDSLDVDCSGPYDETKDGQQEIHVQASCSSVHTPRDALYDARSTDAASHATESTRTTPRSRGHATGEVQSKIQTLMEKVKQRRMANYQEDATLQHSPEETTSSTLSSTGAVAADWRPLTATTPQTLEDGVDLHTRVTSLEQKCGKLVRKRILLFVSSFSLPQTP